MNTRLYTRLWTQAGTATLIAGLHLAATVPIAGATYRPFSWMTLTRADSATLYPVVQNLVFDGAGVAVSADVTPGASYVLQRSTNLMNPTGWQDIVAGAATNPLLTLLDTNPAGPTMYYRVVERVAAELP